VSVTKIVTIVGARPQFIKAAVISRAIDEQNSRGDSPALKEVLVHTGQHHDENMSDVFFREMHIPAPAYNLGVAGGTHGAMTGRMLEKIEEVLLAEKPDAVLVYGDTNSTLAGALSAVKLHIPVGHVEAGLRSLNMRMPEEINRIIADRISRWLFCPTETAVRNLRSEGLPPASILHTGDVMYDAVLFYGAIASPSPMVRRLLDELPNGFSVCTMHRAENTDQPEQLRDVLAALDEIATEIAVVLPVHPRTRKQLGAFGISWRHLRVIEPVSYFDMICLLRGCKAVLTDSGGLQKEAFFFGKPCLTLRNETEWVELVDSGVNILGGVHKESILRGWETLKSQKFDFSARPYGNGRAGQAVVSVLKRGTLV
jgi:UDP-GlcNAc3NAcA epimerase